MSDSSPTWEQAVIWLRLQPDQQDLVRSCYYDDPLIDAARRFTASEEWQATLPLFANLVGGQALDLGAGRGISSYALAQAGFYVTSIEPDGSDLVGAGAIRWLAEQNNLSIHVIQEFGENIPCSDCSMDMVYARQVLHHAQNLPQLCKEIGRVLKPGGILVAVREHVINRKSDLQIFLANHPLHSLYGGENAFQLAQYERAFKQADLRLSAVFGPEDSVINYFPVTSVDQDHKLLRRLTRLVGQGIAVWVWRSPTLRTKVSVLLAKSTRYLSRTPGRLFSFVAVKPK